MCLCMVMMWAGLLGGCQGSDDETETTAVETDAYDETENLPKRKRNSLRYVDVHIRSLRKYRGTD